MTHKALWLIGAAMTVVACDSGGAPSTSTGAAPTSTADAPKKDDVAAEEMGTFVCADVKDDACIGQKDEFAADAPVIHVTYKTKDIPKEGDVYHIAWIAEDVGQAAPANTVIRTLDKNVAALPDIGVKNYVVNAQLTKPDKGWPIGKYRVEIKLGDNLVTTARFTVE